MLTTRVIFLGADASGKTTLLYKLKLNEIVMPLPTIGFNVEEIEYKDRKMLIWDIGGGEKVRPLWYHYFNSTKCIVFFMNISDKERFDYFIDSFNILMKGYKDYLYIPLIIFGNKFNDKIEFEPEDMLQKCDVPPEISPFILKGNVITGEGIPELLDYIYNNIEFEHQVEKEENEEEEEPIKEVKTDYKIKMFGLDGAGKTAILYLLTFGEEVKAIPTMGFNVETIEKKNWDKNITIWDIGGQEKIRHLWHHYLNEINGLIWVYDLSDNQRIEESQKELKTLLNYEEMNNNLPLLIFANKSDLSENKNKVDIFINGIQDYLNNRPYYIKECNKNDIESYHEGLEWLYNNLN